MLANTANASKSDVEVTQTVTKTFIKPPCKTEHFQNSCFCGQWSAYGQGQKVTKVRYRAHFGPQEGTSPCFGT